MFARVISSILRTNKDVRPYAHALKFRVVAGNSPVRGNVCHHSVGRGLAPAVYA